MGSLPKQSGELTPYFPCDALKHVSAEDPLRGKLVMGHKSIQQTRHCGFDVTLVMEYHGILVQNEGWSLYIQFNSYYAKL